MRLRDDKTGRFVSFDDYIDRQGEGIKIEGTAPPQTERDEGEFIPMDEYDGDFIEMEFDDMDVYP